MTVSKREDLGSPAGAASAGTVDAAVSQLRLPYKAVQHVALRDHGARAPIFDDGLWHIIDANNPEKVPVAVIDFADDHHEPARKQAAEIAAFIVRACNAHDDLLAALKDARNYVDAVVANSGDTKRRANYSGCVSRIDAAIAKATHPVDAAKDRRHTADTQIKPGA